MPVGELQERMGGLELALWPTFLEQYYKMKYGSQNG
jgi:hypothetical protein